VIVSIKSTLIFLAFISALIYSAFAGSLGQSGPFFAAVTMSLVGAFHIIYKIKTRWLLGLGLYLLAGVLIGFLSYEAGSISALILPIFVVLTASLICLPHHAIEKLHCLSIFKILSYFALFFCLVSIFYPDPYRSGLWTSIFNKPNNFGLFLVTTTMLLYLGNISGNLRTLLFMFLLIFISVKVGSRSSTVCMVLLSLIYISRYSASNVKYIAAVVVVVVLLNFGYEYGLFSTFEDKVARRGGIFETTRVMIWLSYIPSLEWFGISQKIIDEGLHSSWLWLLYNLGIIPGVYFSLLIIVMIKKHLSSLEILSGLEVITFLIVFVAVSSVEVIFYKPFYVLFLILLATSPKTYERQTQTESVPSERKIGIGIQ
jgi:hypothetical protein